MTSAKSGMLIEKDNFRKLKMPDEGCRGLLWAVTLGYLLPVRNNEIIFKKRFEKLFGAESDSEKSVRELILNHSFSEVYKDPRLIELVTQVFRDRVKDQVSKREVGNCKDERGAIKIETIKSLLHCQINIFDGQFDQLTLEQNICATIFLFLNENNFELCLVKPKVIVKALKNVNYKLALSLVKIGIEGVNDADDVGWTLLHYATTTDNYHRIIQHLVDQGADLSLRNKNQQTALDLARFLKQEKSIAALTNYLGDNAEVIKQEAIIPTNIEKLVKQTCSSAYNAVNAINSIVKNENIELNNSNFSLAVLENDVQAVKNLIKIGIDVNQKIMLENDGENCYPLHVATRKGYLQMVNIMLLEGETEVNIKDCNSATSLYAAAQSGSNLILDYLIDKGAEVNAVDARGMTPLHHTVLDNQWKSVFSLVEHKANLNLLNNDGQSALSMAIFRGNWKMVRYLLENGAFLLGLSDEIKGEIYRKFIKSLRKDEQLHQAVALGNVELLQRLIRKNSIENEALFEIYEKFKILNVKLNSQISVFVENKLMDDRYYSDKQISEKKEDFDIEQFNVKGRIQLVINCVDTLLLSDDNEVNDAFLFVIKFIVKHLQVLKQCETIVKQLPCEEMQFCLSTFLMTYLEPLKIDVCVNLILHKRKILNYLSGFKIELLKLNFDNLNVNEQNSWFKELRKDFVRLKDLRSLHRMDRYLSVACAVDLKNNPEIGKLVIERALQVSGECLKNTADCPNFSEKVQEELLNFAPVNTSKTVSNLRDVFSHVSSLVIKIHNIENNNNNVTYFQQIQNDLRHLKPGITYLLYSKNIEIINKFLKNIGNCESMEQVREVVSGIERFDKLEVPVQMGVEQDSYRVVGQLAANVEELKKSEGSQKMTDFKRMDLNKCSDLLDKIQSRNRNIRETQVHLLKRFNDLISLIENGNYSLGLIQEKARLIIEKDLDTDCFNHELNRVVSLIPEVTGRPKPLNLKDPTSNLFVQYNQMRIGDTKAIDRFKSSLEHSNNLQENNLRLLNQLDEQCVAIANTIEDPDLRDKFKAEYESKKEIHGAKNRLLQFYQQLISLDFEEFTKLMENINFKFLKKVKDMSSCSSMYAQKEQSTRKKIIQQVNHRAMDPLGKLLKLMVDRPEKTDFSTEIFGYFKTFESIKKLNLNPDIVEPTDSYIRKYFVDKLRVLETIFDLKKPDSELLKSLKTSDELRLALEMLALTLMQILEKFSVFESNKLYLDEKLPVLIGKNLRNYLAHGDLTIDALFIDPLKALVYHLRAIRDKCSKTEFIVYNGDKRIGKIIHENIDETETQFFRSLELLRKKDKLIETVKNNKILDLQNLIVNYLELKYRDVNNRTLLYFATKTDFFKLLLNNDLNIYSRDKFQHSILYYLAKNNNVKILKFLKDNYNLNPNVIVTAGKSLLHLSAEFDHPELAHWLLSIDVHKDEFDNHNFTPLMLALSRKHANTAGVLWRAKASVDVNQLTRLANLSNIGAYQKLVNCTVNEKLSNNKIDEALAKAEQLLPNFPTLYNIDNIEDEDEKVAFIRRLNAGDLEHIVLEEGLKVVLARSHFPADVGQRNADDNTFISGLLQLACLAGSVKNVKFLMDTNCVKVNTVMNLGETALHMAAGLGHLKLVKFLLGKKADLTILSENGDSVLHKAAFQDDVNIVRMLIERGTDIGLLVHAKNKDGETALHKAAKKGQCDVVELLLSAGAEVNCPTIDGTSALHMAVLANSLKTVEVLLKNGADVNAVNMFGESVAQLVCFKGNIKMLEILFSYPVKINVSDKRNNTPLSSAIFGKKKKMVELLLREGADVNFYHDGGFSPLHIASQVGHLKILKLLLEKKPNFTIDRTGHTPLHLAVFYGHAEILEALLLKYPEDTRVKDADKTALHYAACWGQTQMVDILLKHGVDVDATDISKNSALHYAVVGGFYKIVEKLLLRNAKTDLKNALGSTALHHAASKGDKNVLELLLNADKSTINAANNEGVMPLHLAVQRAHFDSVKLLLDNGADVRAKETSTNLSPLHVAVEHGSCALLELLLDYGAEINAEDENRFTSFNHAVAKGDKSMLRVLIKRGASANEKEARPFFTLFVAVDLGHDDVVSVLVKNGADVNAYYNGVSSLHVAAMYGRKTAAEILIKNGAKVEALDRKRQTPAHRAAIHGHHELIKVLHKHRADLNVRDIDNFTPFHFAVENKHKLCILYLYLFGADVSEVTGLHYPELSPHEAIVKMVASNDGKELVSAVTDNSVTSSFSNLTMLNFTSDSFKNLLLTLGPNEAAFKNLGANFLHSAVQRGDLASVKMLLNFNPDLNAKNERGSSPLHVAVSLGHYEISEVLISAGADVFSRNYHDSVLHPAVRNVEILKLVLTEIKKKCAGDANGLRLTLNAPDAEGDTPLMWAVEKGRLSATKLLLDCDGVDVNRQNLKGWTALYWAVDGGHLEIVNDLLDKRADVKMRNENGETAHDLAAAKRDKTEDAKYEIIAALLLSLSDDV